MAKSFLLAPILRRLFRRGAVTQAAINRVYTLPEWNLPLRLAQTLSVFFAIVMYAGTMPVLNIIGFLYCILAYWLDKWCLLRGSARPPQYNEKIVVLAMDLFPIAGFLHTAWTLWTFGNSDMFPSYWSIFRPFASELFDIPLKEYNKVVAAYRDGTDNEKETYFNRFIHSRILDFSKESCWALFLVMLVFLVYLILFYLWHFFFMPILSPVLFWCRKHMQRTKAATTEASVPAQSGIAKRLDRRSTVVASYKLSANYKYRDAYRAIKDCSDRSVHTRGEPLPASILEEPTAAPTVAPSAKPPTQQDGFGNCSLSVPPGATWWV